jgi:hypothetical protein
MQLHNALRTACGRVTGKPQVTIVEANDTTSTNSNHFGFVRNSGVRILGQKELESFNRSRSSHDGGFLLVATQS